MKVSGTKPVRAEVTSRPPVPLPSGVPNEGGAARQVAMAVRTKAYARARATMSSQVDARRPGEIPNPEDQNDRGSRSGFDGNAAEKILLRMMTKVTKVSGRTRTARRTRITRIGSRIRVQISGELYRQMIKLNSRKPVANRRKGHLLVAFSLRRLQGKNPRASSAY